MTIEGGNHSGFGLYGQQQKDGTPVISASEQQDEIIQQIIAFLSQEKIEK